jgi:hypothetical protein
MTLPKNLEVAKLQSLNEIAARTGIGGRLLEPYDECALYRRIAADL